MRLYLVFILYLHPFLDHIPQQRDLLLSQAIYTCHCNLLLHGPCSFWLPPEHIRTHHPCLYFIMYCGLVQLAPRYRSGLQYPSLSRKDDVGTGPYCLHCGECIEYHLHNPTNTRNNVPYHLDRSLVSFISLGLSDNKNTSWIPCS